MTIRWLAAAVVLLWTCGVAAQAQRDFLTSDEADQLRLVQEPEPRLRLYVQFAKLRLDLAEQMLAKNQPGRSAQVHRALEEYSRILDAMDTVIDDMLRKQKEVASLKFVANAGREMLSKLKKMADVEAPDADRWRFVLEQAIETTEDSVEMAELDLKDRRRDAEMEAAEERKRQQEMMTPERKKETEERAQKEAEATKKRPSLLRKGESIKK